MVLLLQLSFLSEGTGRRLGVTILHILPFYCAKKSIFLKYKVPAGKKVYFHTMDSYQLLVMIY